MSRYLEWSIDHMIEEKLVVVALYDVMRADEHIRCVGLAEISTAGPFGLFAYDLPRIVSKITKAQTKLLAEFRKNDLVIGLVDRLCKEYSVGRLILQDTKTDDFLGDLINKKKKSKFNLKILPGGADK